MSGFHNAEITKGLLLGVAATSLAASLLDIKPYLHLQLVPHITKYHQFFRIAFHPVAFANSTELVVGLLALSTAGTSVERAFGPRKYAAFLLLSSGLSTLLALCALILGHGLGLRYIPSGPYGVLFSILWQKHRIVPAIYTFRIMGVEFSPKTFSYVLVSQLVLSDPPASMIAALSGILAGYIYNLDSLPLPSTPLSRRRSLRPLKSYRLPTSIHNLLGRLFRPILGASAPPRRAHQTLPGQTNETQLRAQARGLTALLGSRMGLGGEAAGTGPGVSDQAAPRRARTASAAGRSTPTSVPTAAAAPSSNDTTGAGEVRGTERARTTVREQVANVRSGTESARAAMGEWVSELAGRNARAPTEAEISALSNMFPNIGRDRIVRALQRSDYNTAQAVEALLEENT